MLQFISLLKSSNATEPASLRFDFFSTSRLFSDRYASSITSLITGLRLNTCELRSIFRKNGIAFFMNPGSGVIVGYQVDVRLEVELGGEDVGVSQQLHRGIELAALGKAQVVVVEHLLRVIGITADRPIAHLNEEAAVLDARLLVRRGEEGGERRHLLDERAHAL